jgi:hypothetical protein
MPFWSIWPLLKRLALAPFKRSLTPMIAGGRPHSYNEVWQGRNPDVGNAELKQEEQRHAPEGSIIQFWSVPYFLIAPGDVRTFV